MVLNQQILAELPEVERGGRQHAHELGREIDRRHVVRVVRVLDHIVEAEKRGEAFAIEREPRRRQRGGTERAAVHSRVRRTQSLAVAIERLRGRRQIVCEGRRLRLHVERVGRHDRLEMPAGERQQLPA